MDTPEYKDRLVQCVESYRAALLDMAIRKGVLREDAEDIVQDTIIAVIAKCRYDIRRSSLLTYLSCVLRRKMVDKIRYDQKRGVRISLKENGSLFVTDRDAKAIFQEKIEREEKKTAVTKTLEAMPQQYREVLSLCFLRGITYTGAADLLNLPIGTAKSRIFRAKDVFVENMVVGS